MQQPDTQGWWVPECRQPHSHAVSCGLNLLTSSSCSIWAPSLGTECKDVAGLHGNSQDLLLPYRTDNQGLPQTMDKLKAPVELPLQSLHHGGGQQQGGGIGAAGRTCLSILQPPSRVSGLCCPLCHSSGPSALHTQPWQPELLGEEVV